MTARKTVFSFLLLYLIGFGWLLNRSLDLHFNGDLLALLPEDNPHIETYEALSNLGYSGEGGFDAVLYNPSGEQTVQLAHEITDSVLKLTVNGERIFKGAELENDLYDVRYSALYFMTAAELDSTYSELNELIEEAKREANPLYVEFDEGENEQTADSESTLALEQSVLLEEVLNSRRYNISEDSTVIFMRFMANFPRGDYDQIASAYELLLTESKTIEQRYGNDIELHWEGGYVNHFHKINSVQKSVLTALIIGTGSLILFLVSYIFYLNRGRNLRKRYVLQDLGLIFFALFSGFIISLGLSSFLFDEINVFTGIIFSILFGINLDYILHVYAVNKKQHVHISTVHQVMKNYLVDLRPVMLSGITTGLAILSLIFSGFDGFKQFGFIFFINIIVNFFATILFLLFSKSGIQADAISEENEPSVAHEGGKLTDFLMSTWADSSKKARAISLSSLLLVFMAMAYFGATHITFSFDFSALEPDTPPTEFDKKAGQISSGNSYHTPAYYITDTMEEARDLFFYLRENIDQFELERVESFAARYPQTEEQLAEKSPKVESISALVRDNESLIRAESESADEWIDIALKSQQPNDQNLPDYLKNRFYFRDGSIAPMVIIYPDKSLSNGKRSIQFRKSSGSATVEGETYYASSTFIIASSILELLINESRFLLVVPLLTIVMIITLYYRSVVPILVALSPLIITIIILLAIRAFITFDINLYNVIVLPIIIGVGADNGIHMADVWLRDRNHFARAFWGYKLPVLAACSVTTVLGFVGLLFINHPGMESLGWLAVVGIASNLLAVFLASLGVNAVQGRVK
jgi:predicted RND superfamily exporter protein